VRGKKARPQDEERKKRGDEGDHPLWTSGGARGLLRGVPKQVDFKGSKKRKMGPQKITGKGKGKGRKGETKTITSKT